MKTSNRFKRYLHWISNVLYAFALFLSLYVIYAFTTYDTNDIEAMLKSMHYNGIAFVAALASAALTGRA